jgi:hypothetical protein
MFSNQDPGFYFIILTFWEVDDNPQKSPPSRLYKIVYTKTAKQKESVYIAGNVSVRYTDSDSL